MVVTDTHLENYVKYVTPVPALTYCYADRQSIKELPESRKFPFSVN